MEETEEEGMEVEKSEDEKQMEAMQKMAGITNDEDPDNEGMKNYMEDEEEMEMDSEEEMEMDSEEEMEMDSEDEYSDEEEMEMDSEEGEEISDEELEEILRELDNGSEDEMEMDSEEEVDSEGKMKMEMNYEGEMSDEDEEIDLEEIIAALREEDEMEMDSEEEAPEASEELEEAYGVIKYLRTKINEVNLLNAKLLYVNKLFRKGELTETQKVKIIETFDRAKNVREAKLIYATLSESVSNKKTKTTVAPKRKMNEGFASAPSKKTQIISESNGVYNRFKTLVEYNNKK